MLLAGDVGGTKTLLGLFEPSARRPIARATRTYETSAFSSIVEIIDVFLREVKPPARVHAAALGVAGPVVHDGARLTNVGWHISAPEIRSRLETARVQLLNDLEPRGRTDRSGNLRQRAGRLMASSRAVTPRRFTKRPSSPWPLPCFA